MRTLVSLSLFLALIVCATSVNAQYLWCEGMDYVYAEVEGSTITVHHKNTIYNCCPEAIDFQVNQQGYVIDISEHEILGDDICLCNCCFDVFVEIEDVAPGDYEIFFSWWDYETQMWQEWTVYVTVPDVGQAGDLIVTDMFSSPCLQEPTSSSPDPADPTVQHAAWGAVKSLYR